MTKEKRFCCIKCQSSQPRRVENSTVVNRNRSRVTVLESVPEIETRADVSSEGEDFLGFTDGGAVFAPLQRPIEPAHNGSILTYNGNEAVEEENEEDIPDASKWSVDEVYEYFRKFYPRHAHVFEDEEIDGTSLYDLERQDVMQRFKIKMGPCLKLWQHITKIQNKRK